MTDISTLSLPSFTNQRATPELQGGPERAPAPTPQPPESQESTVGDRVTISERARELVADALQSRREASPLPPQARTLPEGVEVTRDGGNVTVSREVETSFGGTQTRELSVTVDPSTQTVERSRSFTGATGQSVTVNGSLTRTDTGFESSVTVTGPNGNEVTRSVEQSFDRDAGTFSRSVSLSGGAYDVNRSTQLTRVDGGISAEFKLDVARADAPADETVNVEA
ncbi:MAG: hypothetical protein AAFX85_04625 [Pseudomonadota bacterium]